jgi:hypothetical protein
MVSFRICRVRCNHACNAVLNPRNKSRSKPCVVVTKQKLENNKGLKISRDQCDQGGKTITLSKSTQKLPRYVRSWRWPVYSKKCALESAAPHMKSSLLRVSFILHLLVNVDLLSKVGIIIHLRVRSR